MNAITLPKNPPTAMMGIRISISSSRRRSFARSDPLALAVLREQPFGEVHALGELRHLAPHGLELLIERILLFRELGAQIAATGRGALAADPVGDRKSTRLNSSHDQISYAVFCLKKKKSRIGKARSDGYSTPIVAALCVVGVMFWSVT